MTHEVRPDIAERRRRAVLSTTVTALMVVVMGGTALALARPWSHANEPVLPIGSSSDAQMVTSPTSEPTESGDPAVGSADLQRVTELFLKFARGERDGVPADTPIDLYVGGTLVKTIPSSQQSDRKAWEGCPQGVDHYAGRDCPISAIAPLAEWSGPMSITSNPPRHPCAHPSQPPPSLSAYRSVTLTPDADLDCANYVAVQLFINDVSQVVAVNVVWSEP